MALATLTIRCCGLVLALLSVLLNYLTTLLVVTRSGDTPTNKCKLLGRLPKKRRDWWTNCSFKLPSRFVALVAVTNLLGLTGFRGEPYWVSVLHLTMPLLLSVKTGRQVTYSLLAGSVWCSRCLSLRVHRTWLTTELLQKVSVDLLDRPVLHSVTLVLCSSALGLIGEFREKATLTSVLMQVGALLSTNGLLIVPTTWAVTL